MKWFRPHRDEGSQVVETAFALPLLVVIAFGIIQFGMMLNRTQGVHAAAREAGRVASIEDTQLSSVQARAVSALPNWVDPNDLTMTVTRVVTYGDNSQNTHTWTYNPNSGNWSNGTASDIPCHDDLKPDHDDPPLAGEIVENDVTVQLELLNPQDYGVQVPLFGTYSFSHPSLAAFHCEY